MLLRASLNEIGNLPQTLSYKFSIFYGLAFCSPTCVRAGGSDRGGHGLRAPLRRQQATAQNHKFSSKKLEKSRISVMTTHAKLQLSEILLKNYEPLQKFIGTPTWVRAGGSDRGGRDLRAPLRMQQATASTSRRGWARKCFLVGRRGLWKVRTQDVEQ